MLEKTDSSAADLADREIVTTRVFDVPRRQLFNAWTDPDHLAQWWGPKGFTNTFQEFDLRPGGVWRFVMRGPNGAEYPNESVFVEIVEPVRLVFQHLKPVHKFQVTASFENLGGKTRLVWRMLFESAAECETAKRYVVEANEQNLDRLEAQLAKDPGAGDYTEERRTLLPDWDASTLIQKAKELQKPRESDT